MKSTQSRILNGIKFFRLVVNPQAGRYESKQVITYLPKFLDLVEEFISGAKQQTLDLCEEAKKIFVPEKNE